MTRGWCAGIRSSPACASFGLDGVITAHRPGACSAPTSPAWTPPQRLDPVKQLLAQLRVLLVWDNFETGPGDARPGRRDPAAGRGGLRAAAGVPGVGARSLPQRGDHHQPRARRSWLGQVRRIDVGGLNRAEAAEYAGHLLAPYPAAQARRERRSFGELLDWLDGHPLAMRLTLPRLDTTDPADLLAALRGTTPLPAGGRPGRGPDHSLPASITYSFAHLSEQTRRLLPAVSLFHGVADADVLTVFSTVEGVPGRFAGVSKQEWTAVLEDAARVGLLTGLGAGMYRIHPALPGYLAAGWHAEDPAGYDQEREACEQALCAACAAFGQWLTGQIESGDAALAYAVIGLQRRTLGAMLGHALDHHAWDDAEGIVRALDAYWDTRGLGEEAAAWADRILAATTGPGQDTPAAEPAWSLWLYTTIRRPTGRRTPGSRTRPGKPTSRPWPTCRTSPKPNGPAANIAVVYHQLGMTAQDRGRLDEADDWYRKALTIKEELGDRPRMASTYHQLGMTAQDRGRLDEADDWYRKALTINEDLGDRPGMARTYHQLGMTAQVRGRLDEADDWYRKALTIAKNSATGPAWRPPTTSSASPPSTAGGWTRPTTGTANPSPSTKTSATGPAWR